MFSYRPIVERGLGIARSGARQAGRLGRLAATQSYGMAQRIIHLRRAPKEGVDDVTLARKVETEVFRGADAPKGDVSVNAVDGVVWLRGEVKTPELIRELERKTRRVAEVREVENLLHLPKTPARRQTTRAGGGKAPRRNPRRVSADKERAEAEPKPDEVASEGKGRHAAPLGNTGERR